ncbi:hypothetical protein GCM10017600_38590 [Streptosporangium carneum]|uniref:Uncharacterized protein n=1 Tax=Streptosporangium carneum TaxID=47481 RepID=A0A9W6ME30_9ACTN|nr:hypothetical protein GCM10017600_38590 [Streptosporangium carneum]
MITSSPIDQGGTVIAAGVAELPGQKEVDAAAAHVSAAEETGVGMRNRHYEI